MILFNPDIVHVIYIHICDKPGLHCIGLRSLLDTNNDGSLSPGEFLNFLHYFGPLNNDASIGAANLVQVKSSCSRDVHPYNNLNNPDKSLTILRVNELTSLS